MQVLVPLPFQDWWVAVSWCKHLPVCLSVCPSVNTQVSSALWPSSVMPLWTRAFVHVSGSSGGVCLILFFFFLGTANLFPTAAASSSIPTRVLLFSMLANAGCFSFSQGSSNGCELVVRVLGCSLLVFQLSMSFLATCVYFLEKWLLKSWPVLRTALFIACYWVGGVWNVFSWLAVWLGDPLSHSLACSFTPLIVSFGETHLHFGEFSIMYSPYCSHFLGSENHEWIQSYEAFPHVFFL